jgi:hypothetical protein
MNKMGVQHRGVIEHSCVQKRIYTTLSRAGSQWRGQWSEWAPCGKLDPDNPLVLVPNKASEPIAIIKRAGAWSVTGAKYNIEPKPMRCEDVPPDSGDWNTWIRGFLSRRETAPAR